MKEQDETTSRTTSGQPGKSENGGDGIEEVQEAVNGEDERNSSSKSEAAGTEEQKDATASEGKKEDGSSKASAEPSLNAAKSPVPAPLYPYLSYPPYPYPPPFAMPPPGSALPGNPMTSPANPHEYTDVSTMSDPVPDNRNRGGVSEIFPIKLHKMLEQTELEGLSDLVSFFSHGRAFAIHKPRRFVAEVMNRFFRQSRFTSFQRQLNLYGFKRISQGPDNGGYYHELFLKGRPGLCVNMKRTRVKGNAKLRRDPDTEPNFYTYPPISKSGQNVATGPPATGDSATHPARASSPQAPVATPPAPMYPGYMYPAPPYPSMSPNSGPYTAAQSQRAGPIPPYTAAQQQKNGPSSGAPIYAYPPPYYAYSWYPPPGHAPPHLAAQQSQPKGAGMPQVEASGLAAAIKSEESPKKVRKQAAV